jgi:hypothetical protein
MERTDSSDGIDESVATPKKAKQPLWQKMYFQRHMTAIVRLMGYDELPLDDARERLRPLLAEYGKERIEEAAADLITIDSTREPALARLSDEARKLAVQILGRPRECSDENPSEPAAVTSPSEPVPVLTAPASDPASTSVPARKRRSRSKKVDATETSATNAGQANGSTPESGRKRRTKSGRRCQAQR